MTPSETSPPGQGDSLKALSIRARAALGAVCLRRYALAYGIQHPAINELVDYLFALASAQDIVRWERQAPMLAHTMEDALPAEIAQAVGSEHAVAFLRLRDELLEIGYCDLYAATTDESRQHLLAVFRILETDHIALPDLTPFQVSSFDENHGWGNVVSAEIADRWRAYQ